MPNFVLTPATAEECESIVRIEFDACAEDPGFSVIYPQGATSRVVDHYTRQIQNDLVNDPSCSIMVVKDVGTKRIASFATWNIFPNQHQDDLDREMLTEDWNLPADANVEAGNRLIGNGIRRRHEIMSTQAYAYLAAVGTSLPYRKQGAASMLLAHFTKLVDEQRLPAYVEGTPDGLGIYRKYGFEQVDMLKLDVSPWKEGDFYNVCMIRPAKAKSVD